jgi:nucleoside phosphorylase
VLVVITFALDSEFAPWRRLRSFRRRNDTARVYESQIDGVRLRIVVTGIGARAAAATAAIAFREEPDLCIAAGLAGGLHDSLAVADIVAPATVYGPDGTSVECDASLLSLARGCGALEIAALYSARAVVVTAAEKREFAATAQAVDMESRAVLGHGQIHAVPGIAIRAVSDLAAVDLPIDLNRVISPRGHVSRMRLARVLALRPRAVSGLVRLGLDGHRAAVALSVFLEAYVQRLAAR